MLTIRSPRRSFQWLNTLPFLLTELVQPFLSLPFFKSQVCLRFVNLGVRFNELIHSHFNCSRWNSHIHHSLIFWTGTLTIRSPRIRFDDLKHSHFNWMRWCSHFYHSLIFYPQVRWRFVHLGFRFDCWHRLQGENSLPARQKSQTSNMGKNKITVGIWITEIYRRFSIRSRIIYS